MWAWNHPYLTLQDPSTFCHFQEEFHLGYGSYGIQVFSFCFGRTGRPREQVGGWGNR